jgi:hypothetical protein
MSPTRFVVTTLLIVTQRQVNKDSLILRSAQLGAACVNVTYPLPSDLSQYPQFRLKVSCLL